MEPMRLGTTSPMRIVRRVSQAAGFGMAIVALWLCSVSARAESDLNEIKVRGTLRILAVISEDSDYFLCTNPRKNPGFDQEILQGYANLHRLRLQVVPVATWDQLIPALLDGKGDAIAGGFTATESRRTQIDFTVEAFPTRTVIVTRTPAPPIRTLAELRALPKVGTVRSTAMKDALLQAGIPAAAIVELETGVAEGLRQGKAPAGLEALEMALLTARKDPSLEIGLFLGPPGSLAYGIRKEDAELRTSLSEYISNMRRGPGWNRLVVKYFGEQALPILKMARAQ